MALFRFMFGQRTKGVAITDTRVQLLSEVLQGIRLIKYYAWEDFYVHRIGALRAREIATVRKSAWVVLAPRYYCLTEHSLARAGILALMTLIPVLASILSFASAISQEEITHLIAHRSPTL
jgi:ATP-binding cassette subfamily C (CFTR/MRP) protein 1